MSPPAPRTDVPRENVPDIVGLMLADPQVTRVECEEQSDGNFTVTACY